MKLLQFMSISLAVVTASAISNEIDTEQATAAPRSKSGPLCPIHLNADVEQQSDRLSLFLTNKCFNACNFPDLVDVGCEATTIPESEFEIKLVSYVNHLQRLFEEAGYSYRDVESLTTLIRYDRSYSDAFRRYRYHFQDTYSYLLFRDFRNFTKSTCIDTTNQVEQLTLLLQDDKDLSEKLLSTTVRMRSFNITFIDYCLLKNLINILLSLEKNNVKFRSPRARGDCSEIEQF